jgi:YbbR domain-containing protein
VTWLRSTGLRLVLALGLGFSLWVFVSYSVNPDRRIPFDNVPVIIEGLSPGLLVVDKEGLRTSPQPVDVTVEADAATFQEVRASDLHAFVDLQGLGPGEHAIPINVRTTRPSIGRLSFSIDPEFLPIRIEQEVTKTVPITVEVAGIVPFSYEQGKPSTTFNNRLVTEVVVRGPQSRVDRVVLTQAIANIDRLTANYRSPRPLEALAANGEPVEGVEIEPQSILVEVPIISSAGIKRVPVVPQVSGDPASGFIVNGVSVEPRFVDLTGSTGPLERVQSITTLDVSVNGASQTFSQTIALDTPPNTILRADQPTNAVVTVEIAPIDRSFQVTLPVPVRVVNVDDGLQVSFNPTVVNITLSGPATRLEALDAGSLQAVISGRELDPGTHTVVPTIALPEGITLVGEGPRVTLSLLPPPTPTPTPEPTPSDVPPTDVPPTETPEPTPVPPTPTALPPTAASPPEAAPTAGP